jgi:hypothetical protein
VRARSRRHRDAQAVLETALIIPILLLLVCNFIAVMLQVTAQEQLDSAVSLAAQARFQAPQSAYDPPGSRCCPDPRCCARPSGASSLQTGGLPTGCRYAAESFYGTMTFNDSLLHWTPASLCTTGGDSGGGGSRTRPAEPYPGSPQAHITCDVDSIDPSGRMHAGYLDHALNPPFGLEVVTCDAGAALDLSRTPLAWGVFWSPALHAHAEAVPPPFRQ